MDILRAALGLLTQGSVDLGSKPHRDGFGRPSASASEPAPTSLSGQETQPWGREVWATLGPGLKWNLEGRRIDAFTRFPNENPPSPQRTSRFSITPDRRSSSSVLSPRASQAADVLRGRPRGPHCPVEDDAKASLGHRAKQGPGLWEEIALQ